MKRSLLVILSSAVVTSFAGAQPYSNVYVFGESLVDIGNYKTLVAPFGINVPPDPPYSGGRFSNGKVFTEVVADNFGAGNLIASLNGGSSYAYAGARSVFDRILLPGLSIPSVRHQVEDYLASAGGTADPNALYILHDGGNDSFIALSMAAAGQWDAAVALLKQSAQGIAASTALLAQNGAVHFVVPNAPRFSLSPQGGCGNFAMDALGQIYNAELLAGLAGLGASLEVVHFDLFGFQTAIADRFTAGCASCLTTAGVCSDPHNFLTWDQVHFTAATHHLVGDAITLAVLKQRILSLTAAGALSSGESNSLLAKLQSAFGRIEDREVIPALNSIHAFANEVNAFVRSGILTAAQAELLLAGANGILHEQ